MCASKNRAERAEQRAKSKQRRLEKEAEMEPKGKKRPRQEEEGTTPGHARKGKKRKKRQPQEKEDTTPGLAKEKGKGKGKRPQEEDATPGPAGPSRRPRQARPSHEDYNISTPERTKLLASLKNFLKGDLVSSAFWACCQLSDIESLKVLVDIAKIHPNFVLGFDIPISMAITLWTRRLRNSSGSVSGASTTDAPSKSDKIKENSDGKKWVERSEKASELCKQRDNGVCALTKNMDPEVAHIFPYRMLNKTTNTSHLHNIIQSNFWGLLRVFWDDNHVDKWRNKIFPDPQHPDTGVESCFNLICLTRSAQTHWNNGRFALKPLELSDDKKELTVQFFWQPQYDHRPHDPVDLLMEPLSSKGLKFIKKKEKTCFLSSLLKNESIRNIQSGDIFTLTTDDPRSRPLPSWELLEMKWFLQRITAMSGAVGTPELDLNDDDDISFRFNRVYKWIPPPPLPSSVPSMAKQAIEV